MASDDSRHRVSGRLSSEDYERMRYWCAERGITSTQFIEDAVHSYLAQINGDYPMPTLEQKRMNQLTDAIVELIASHRALSVSVNNGFQALLSMTRGDNYLMDMSVGDFDLDEDDVV